MNFIPEQPTKVADVPFFDEVSERDGWRGMATGKSFETLMGEITTSIEKIGGKVLAIQPGVFQTKPPRDGYQLRYVLEGPDGKLAKGRIDVAALPVKDTYRNRKSLSKRKEQSLKMALFNARDAIDGLRRLQALSPGYVALMPWMLPPGSDKNITQLWSESTILNNLLPPGNKGKFVENENLNNPLSFEDDSEPIIEGEYTVLNKSAADS